MEELQLSPQNQIVPLHPSRFARAHVQSCKEDARCCHHSLFNYASVAFKLLGVVGNGLPKPKEIHDLVRSFELYSMAGSSIFRLLQRLLSDLQSSRTFRQTLLRYLMHCSVFVRLLYHRS